MSQTIVCSLTVWFQWIEHYNFHWILQYLYKQYVWKYSELFEESNNLKNLTLQTINNKVKQHTAKLPQVNSLRILVTVSSCWRGVTSLFNTSRWPGSNTLQSTWTYLGKLTVNVLNIWEVVIIGTITLSQADVFA